MIHLNSNRINFFLIVCNFYLNRCFKIHFTSSTTRNDVVEMKQKKCAIKKLLAESNNLKEEKMRFLKEKKNKIKISPVESSERVQTESMNL